VLDLANFKFFFGDCYFISLSLSLSINMAAVNCIRVNEKQGGNYCRKHACYTCTQESSTLTKPGLYCIMYHFIDDSQICAQSLPKPFNGNNLCVHVPIEWCCSN